MSLLVAVGGTMKPDGVNPAQTSGVKVSVSDCLISTCKDTN